MYLVSGATKHLLYDKGDVGVLDKSTTTKYRKLLIKDSVNCAKICDDISDFYVSYRVIEYLHKNNLKLVKKKIIPVLKVDFYGF